ncbi:unnamed protein product [Prunus armeniaca]
MLDLYELAVKVGYIEQTSRFFHKKKKVGSVPIITDKDYLEFVLEFVKHQSSKQLDVIYITNISQQGQILESQASVSSDAAQVNKGKQPNFEHVDVGGEGFVDVDVDLETNGYGVIMNYVQLEDEDEDEFVGVDVQVENEDEDDDEETEFEQNDEENERVYGGFIVNEDEEYHEKEPCEADIDEYHTDDFSSVHESEDEENTTVRGKTKR